MVCGFGGMENLDFTCGRSLSFATADCGTPSSAASSFPAASQRMVLYFSDQPVASGRSITS